MSGVAPSENQTMGQDTINSVAGHMLGQSDSNTARVLKYASDVYGRYTQLQSTGHDPVEALTNAVGLTAVDNALGALVTDVLPKACVPYWDQVLFVADLAAKMPRGDFDASRQALLEHYSPAIMAATGMLPNLYIPDFLAFLSEKKEEAVQQVYHVAGQHLQDQANRRIQSNQATVAAFDAFINSIKDGSAALYQSAVDLYRKYIVKSDFPGYRAQLADISGQLTGLNEEEKVLFIQTHQLVVNVFSQFGYPGDLADASQAVPTTHELADNAKDLKQNLESWATNHAEGQFQQDLKGDLNEVVQAFLTEQAIQSKSAEIKRATGAVGELSEGQLALLEDTITFGQTVNTLGQGAQLIGQLTNNPKLIQVGNAAAGATQVITSIVSMFCAGPSTSNVSMFLSGANTLASVFGKKNNGLGDALSQIQSQLQTISQQIYNMHADMIMYFSRLFVRLHRIESKLLEQFLQVNFRFDDISKKLRDIHQDLNITQFMMISAQEKTQERELAQRYDSFLVRRDTWRQAISKCQNRRACSLLLDLNDAIGDVLRLLSDISGNDYMRIASSDPRHQPIYIDRKMRDDILVGNAQANFVDPYLLITTAEACLHLFNKHGSLKSDTKWSLEENQVDQIKALLSKMHTYLAVIFRWHEARTLETLFTQYQQLLATLQDMLSQKLQTILARDDVHQVRPHNALLERFLNQSFAFEGDVNDPDNQIPLAVSTYNPSTKPGIGFFVTYWLYTDKRGFTSTHSAEQSFRGAATRNNLDVPAESVGLDYFVRQYTDRLIERQDAVRNYTQGILQSPGKVIGVSEFEAFQSSYPLGKVPLAPFYFDGDKNPFPELEGLILPLLINNDLTAQIASKIPQSALLLEYYGFAALTYKFRIVENVKQKIYSFIFESILQTRGGNIQLWMLPLSFELPLLAVNAKHTRRHNGLLKQDVFDVWVGGLSPSSAMGIAPGSNTAQSMFCYRYADRNPLLLSHIAQFNDVNIAPDVLAQLDQRLVNLVNTKRQSINIEMKEFILNREQAIYPLLHSQVDGLNDLVSRFQVTHSLLQGELPPEQRLPCPILITPNALLSLINQYAVDPGAQYVDEFLSFYQSIAPNQQELIHAESLTFEQYAMRFYPTFYQKMRELQAVSVQIRAVPANSLPTEARRQEALNSEKLALLGGTLLRQIFADNDLVSFFDEQTKYKFAAKDAAEFDLGALMPNDMKTVYSTAFILIQDAIDYFDSDAAALYSQADIGQCKQSLKNLKNSCKKNMNACHQQSIAGQPITAVAFHSIFSVTSGQPGASANPRHTAAREIAVFPEPYCRICFTLPSHPNSIENASENHAMPFFQNLAESVGVQQHQDVVPED